MGNADESVLSSSDDVSSDLGASNKEGQEADIQNERLNFRIMLEGSNKAIGNHINKIDMFHGEEWNLKTAALIKVGTR